MQNNTFAISLNQMANVVPPNTTNYKYAITPITGSGTGTNAATAVSNTATPTVNTLKPYIGDVYTTQVTGTITSIAGTTSSTQTVTETNTVTILCKINSPSTTTPTASGALIAPTGASGTNPATSPNCNTSVANVVNN